MQIMNETIWNNKSITINNTPYMWEQCINHAESTTNLFIKQNIDLLSHSEIEQKYDLKCNFLYVL